LFKFKLSEFFNFAVSKGNFIGVPEQFQTKLFGHPSVQCVLFMHVCEYVHVCVCVCIMRMHILQVYHVHIYCALLCMYFCNFKVWLCALLWNCPSPGRIVQEKMSILPQTSSEQSDWRSVESCLVDKHK